jgi:hypothetical protein
MPRAYFSGHKGGSGGSRREAAEITKSVPVTSVKCFHESGCYAAKPRGGSVSPLE